MMSTDKNPVPQKNDSAVEEGSLKNDQTPEPKQRANNPNPGPANDHKLLHETEGERRFREGMVNNSDTDE